MAAQAPGTAAPGHPPGDPPAESVRRAPDPALRPYVHRLAGYAEHPPVPLRRREVPSGSVVVIINLGAPLRVLDPEEPGRGARALRSFAAGLHQRYVVTETCGPSRGVQVDLTPVGARLLFGVPMDGLANRVVDLADLLGAEAATLAERLAAAPDWEGRLAAVERYLAGRLAAAPPPNAGVLWAWRRLRETDGRAAIGGLAAELGWSRKHLVAQFRREVGLPPKTLARILRFDRARRLLAVPGTMSDAEVACACGYYDQAHLIRDVRTFAGCTPAELRRRQLPGEHGIAAG